MTDHNAAPPPATPPPSSTGSQRKGLAVAQIIGAVLLLIVIVFILENTRTVTLRLIFPEVRVSLAIALLIAALLGGVGVLLLQYRHRRKSK
jgi:uncharacterized integral membrane protein